MRSIQLEGFLYGLVDLEGAKVGVFEGIRFEFVFHDQTPRLVRVFKTALTGLGLRKDKQKKRDSEKEPLLLPL